MKKVQTIIFDLDGTLADTAVDVHLCINMALEEMELPNISYEKAKRAIGPGPKNFARLTLPPDKVDLFPEFIKRFRRLYRQHNLDHTRLYPQIEVVLDRLQDRALVVASNKPSEFSRQILRGLGCLWKFKAVLGPEDVSNHKPDPEMILKALERVGGKLETSLMVGDTNNDIHSARAAGVKICAVTYGYSSLELLERENPDFIIHKPLELLSIA